MGNNTAMKNRLDIWSISGWLFGVVMLIVGLLNMFLVHLVPGIAYLLLSLIYLPPANVYFRKYMGFSIPLVPKLILGIVVFFFTLGVSDLGDMIDKL